MHRLLIILILFSLSFNARAASLQARLIRATHEPLPQDERLKEFEPQLKKNFGFPHYQQLGFQRASLELQTTHRLNLGEGFVVFITRQSVNEKLYEIVAEWTSGKVSLVKTTVKLPLAKSIFIKGPEVGKEWIVLALTVVE